MADSNANAEPEIVLDLSRLLSRVVHATPTGVDRCEMAYARGLLAAAPDRLRFAAVHPAGFYGRLRHDAVLRFLDATEERWGSRGFASAWDRRRFVMSALAALRPRLPRFRPHPGGRVYIKAAPNGLTRPRLIQRILKYEQARFVCLVHDLIPLQFPEYGRADGVAKHRARIETITALADGIITNSHATMASLSPWIEQSGRAPATAVAHLGTHIEPNLPTHATQAGERPYFVCIGTIEPRKNHLLLLNLWRRMSEERGAEAIPRLLVIGRRGWENEQVVDMLERCAALKGCVEEYGGLPDRQVQALLAGARGLLLPSFAEGYGMPVTESLALGVPVICSDLPALREAGANLPEFLDPLDGPAWRQAVERYASKRHVALDQSGWSPPTWHNHIAILLKLLHKLAA